MTIKTFPGEKAHSTVGWIISALLIPFSGVWKGCVSIACGKVRGENSLDHAARAGALCVLVRTEAWRPQAGEDVEGCRTLCLSLGGHGSAFKGTLRVAPLRGGRYVSPETDIIHGQILQPLPDGYRFQIIPKNVKVSPLCCSAINICKSHNSLKSIASVIQLSYACVTLYRSRGDQISRYGFAAFGLTVIPYAIMSLVNLIANILSPDYPSLYMVRSEVMVEAERRGGLFDGTVGIIETADRQQNWQKLHIRSVLESDSKYESALVVTATTGADIGIDDQKLHINEPGGVLVVPAFGRHVEKTHQSRALIFLQRLAIVTGFLAFITPYAILGALTKFRAGDSIINGVWTMGWLVGGQLVGILVGVRYSMEPLKGVSELVLMVLALGISYGPAIGGFVVVGKMISETGSCVLTG